MPPSLSNLTARYLTEQARAIAADAVAETPAIEFYDAVPPHAIDARLAWREATAVFAEFGRAMPPTLVPGWANLVAAQPAQSAVVFAVGQYPQLVRDLGALTGELRPTPPGPPIDEPAFAAWVAKADESEKWLAAGVCRLARQWDRAAELLAAADPDHPLTGHERAALEWCRGRRAEAAAIWNELPDSAPVLFNRGVAALFTGDRVSAGDHFRRAVERLPESSGWHHLGRLYLEVAAG